jgi:hypothetical protein
MSDVWIAALVPSVVSALGAFIVVLIQVRNNASLEKLKSDLAQLADRRRTLFERRASVLASVYGKLVDAHEAYQDFLNSGTRWASSPRPAQLHKLAVERGEEFRKAYTRTRILIPEELAGLLDQLNREFDNIARRFIVGRSLGEEEDVALMRAYRATDGIIQTALADVDKAFRAAIEWDKVR